MDIDISPILNSWEYNPEKNVRIIKIGKGKEVLQVRKPLGIEQYDMDGRPDGKKPFSKDSILDEYLERLEKYKKKHKTDERFIINHDDFATLHQEGLLFYYRYLILFQIGDFERTVRDTEHNLKICSLIKKYCQNKEDQIQLLQYRPYIIRINAIANAMLSVKQNMHLVAKEIIDSAIKEINSLDEIKNMTFQFEKIRSLNYLKVTLTQISDKQLSKIDKLKLELEDAVKIENYERAAEIRDRLQQEGLRVEMDDRNEKINYKIRDAEKQKVPYMFILGKKEVQNKSVSVRKHKQGDLGQIDLDEIIVKLKQEEENKSIQ